MRTVRFFLVPTLLGWLAAYVICCLLHVISYPHSDSRSAALIARDYALALEFGGLLIVLPNYVLVVLPLSLADVRRAKRGF